MTHPAGEIIRIADLAHPSLTPLQKAAIAAAEAAGAPDLTVDAVLGLARRQTGLDNFGSDDFRERLALYLTCVAEDQGQSPLGRASLFQDAVRHCVNRLRVEDTIKRHPEILDIKIDRPIMIAGLPRSGTTHLVNVLSADPRLRSLPLWESMEPVLSPAEAVGPGEEDPRLVRTREMWGSFETILPLMPAMHEMAPESTHEDIALQEIDFASYIVEWVCRAYKWRDFTYAEDQTPHYRYGKKVMQLLTWFKGPNRWVNKSPPHMENFGPLTAVYPDATVIVTHRDPVAVIQSALTMICYGDRIRRSSIDIKEVADYWIGRIEHLLRACVRDRHLLPAGRSLDVLFHEYMADQGQTIRRIYEMSGLELTREAEAALNAYLAANPRGKHGRVVYDLKGDFGVDLAALRERFRFYYDRFPVAHE